MTEHSGFNIANFRPSYPHPGKRRIPGRALTPRQLQTLRIVQNYYDNHGYGPTFKEIADLLGPINMNGAVAKVQSLKKKGLLDQDKGVYRSTRITEQGRGYLAKLEE